MRKPYAALESVRTQELHRRFDTIWPFSSTFTFCTLTPQRRRVAFLDQGRLLPYYGVLPHY